MIGGPDPDVLKISRRDEVRWTARNASMQELVSWFVQIFRIVVSVVPPIVT